MSAVPKKAIKLNHSLTHLLFNPSENDDTDTSSDNPIVVQYNMIQ